MTRSPADARRIGMLVPSSNIVVEPYTFAMFTPFGDGASVHFNRFRVVEISDSDASRGQFQLDTILEAAERLAETKPHCIAWSGTAASWLGLETDREMCRAITARTGIPATSAMLAYERWFAYRQIRRLAFVTPYLDEIQTRIIANLGAQDLTVVGERHLRDRGNFSYGTYGPEVVEGLIHEVAPSRPDAIAVICTNFRGAPVAARLEAELKLPVVDSVAVTAAHAMRLAGLDPTCVKGWGGVFADFADMPADA